MNATITSEFILRNGITILAFVIAFYGLVARERKTPFMVQSVYRVCFLVLFSLTLAIIGELFKPIATKLFLISAATLALALISILATLWQEYNRHTYFRSDQLIANLGICRGFRALRQKLRKSPAYEHNAMSLPTKLIASLSESPHLPNPAIANAVSHHNSAPDLSIAATLNYNSLIQIDNALADIAVRFLENDCFVQYTCCSRHPLEGLLQIKSHWENKFGNTWSKMAKRIVLVDGYTPHFGFTDSIYTQRTSEARKHCIAVVEAKRAFSGVHTAIADAFNEIKSHDSNTSGVRSPTLVIYEGCGSLIDLESSEQYRIFIRHVIPSERLWGGMFTLFIESSLSNDNASALKSLSQIYHTENDGQPASGSN